MKIAKYLYLAMVILYIALVIVWFNRYSISYRITGTQPDIIEERSLTDHEYNALQRSMHIRQQISNFVIYGSLFIVMISIICLRLQWFTPTIVVKTMLILALLFALILLLVKGIGFIPGPPIR